MRTGRLSAIALACGGLAGIGTAWMTLPTRGAAAVEAAPAPGTFDRRIVGMRRLTESQYRNAIADIFGRDIRIAGRFEPIVRPAHELIASGARSSSISPAGLEQFDVMARTIAAQVFDKTHRQQFASCQPANERESDRACAEQILAPLGLLLFRRPLTGEEQASYIALAGRGAGPTSSFYKGLELALAAMLVSPHFLYIVETAEPDPANPGHMRLDAWSRASRLSFMLWDSTPNEALLKAAAQGRLTDQKQLAAIAATMVQSPRFQQGLRAFFTDMLLFEKFDELAKDPVIYPYFSLDVAKAMPEQMLQTISDHLLTREGDYRELFTTRRTWVNRALGAVYQTPVSKSQGWVPHEFPAESDRAGLLGLPGFLAMYSHSGRSSPTLRGRAVRELLMCQPVPNPPGNVNFTAVQDIHNKATPTARIRLHAHNTDPVCAACHKITDPIGLSLERFDGIGARRETENQTVIDTSGAMDGVEFKGAGGLGRAVAQNPQTSVCVASRALEYLTGHPAEDEKLVETLEQRFAADGYRIRNLFLRAATMPETYRVGDRPVGTPTTVSARRQAPGG